MNKIKILLLLWPIVLICGVLLHFSYERRQIDSQLSEPDGMIWKTEKQHFIVHIDTQEEGELLHINIRVAGPDNTDIYVIRETIDRDMFGGGFVRAVQTDEDPDLEVLVWHARSSYILDFKKGQVETVSFDKAPQAVKVLAGNWHQYNVMAGLETTLLFIFVFCYYVIFFIINRILNFYNQKKKKRL
jgi:hypothetical protein